MSSVYVYTHNKLRTNSRRVVAEGVKTEAQLSFLQARGILFYKPCHFEDSC